MTSIKSRFLKCLPSIYSSKQHVQVQPLTLPHYPTIFPTKEVDIFQECEIELDNSIPIMLTSSSSSSSSSSPASSPAGSTGKNCIETLIGFEENSTPNMLTSSFSSSSSSSPLSSPTGKNCLETLTGFEEKCPPEGTDKVILYTTSVRGIRKTYEDCNEIKFLLDSFRVMYIERDVSMHLEYRDELWVVLGCKSLPPKLFIKGKYIGGADQVIRLHENGMLKMLLEGIPSTSVNVKCKECCGMRFLVCLECNGSCKVYKGGVKYGCGLFSRCSKCNENGLIKCSTCSY